MTNSDVKQHLKDINIKSNQLLRRLEYNIDTGENFEVDEITRLTAIREQLISNFFKQYSIDVIQKELELINQMVNLDTDLQVKTKELKQTIASKLIKVQKGKKSALTYKKY